MIYHVRLAAGLECLDVQLPLRRLPTLYRGCTPVITGWWTGTSATDNTFSVKIRGSIRLKPTDQRYCTVPMLFWFLYALWYRSGTNETDGFEPQFVLRRCFLVCFVNSFVLQCEFYRFRPSFGVLRLCFVGLIIDVCFWLIFETHF